MARLIDAELLLDDMKKELEKASEEDLTSDEAMVIITSAIALKDFVTRQPTVDAVEVVHGEWEVCEDDWNEEVTYKCSNCGDELVTLCGFEIDWNYCPNCGAKMDGEEM